MLSRKQLKRAVEMMENIVILCVAFTLVFCLFLPSFSAAMGKDDEKIEETEEGPSIGLTEPRVEEETDKIPLEVLPEKIVEVEVEVNEVETAPTPPPTVSETVNSMNSVYTPVAISGRWTEDKNYYDVPLENKHQDVLRQLCKDYNVSFPLMLSLIQIESDFDPNCISSTNDYGICQINKCHMEWLSAVYKQDDYLDMYFSMECGTFLLSRFLDLGYTVEQALMCYNLSEHGMLRKWNNGIKHTYYSDKILQAYDNLTIKI